MVLEDIAAMVRDRAWRLPGSVLRHIRSVLPSLADPSDFSLGQPPGLELFEDAFLIGPIGESLRLELEGYRRFRSYRDRLNRHFAGAEERALQPMLLERKRRQIRRRIQDKRLRRLRVADRARGRAYWDWPWRHGPR